MNEAKQEIKKLSELIKIGLVIPPYQRPYKWKAENVTQLLEDIFEHVLTKEKVYRIGNLIVHEDNSLLNIVDGQQRLITISILLSCLGETEGIFLNQNFRHKISKDNIIYNYRVIRDWLSKIPDKALLKIHLLEKCEFVLFTVYDQDEAFQLFDSQNARG